MVATRLHFRHALLPEGWARDVTVTVADGVLSGIEADSDANAADERHAVALPGMPNVHSHAFQRAMAGRAERRGPDGDDFWTWRDQAYRVAARLDPDSARIVAAMAQVEMLETGFTRVGEFHYLHHAPDGQPYDDPAAMSGAIVAAAQVTGIALTHLPVFYAHSGFGGLPPTEGQRRFVHELDGFARLVERACDLASALPDAVVGIAPHSLRAVTPGELHALEAMAPGAPLHIHIAEQVREVEECRAATGTTPVRWLLDHADVSDRWCFVHATHVDADEIAGMAASGAVVGLCPITEANLGDGIFPAEAYLHADGRIAVGSDSNVRIDLPEEMRLLEYGQRLSLRRRAVLASRSSASVGRTLFDAALAGGAQALGTPAGLAVGNPADIVSLGGDALLPGGEPDDLLDDLVFAGGRKRIDRVWRRGELLVERGVHRMREAIEAELRSILPSLLA